MMADSTENLNGAVGIITGAAQGLGYAIAKAYVREGMRVALMDIKRTELTHVADELASVGGNCLPIVVDLSDATDTERAIQTALDHYGTPRVVVHNAAILVNRPLLEITSRAIVPLGQPPAATVVKITTGFEATRQ